jgi:DNA-binding NarL/FixJ family response regulator
VIERVYADHSNKLKTMANEARLASVRTKTLPYSSSAKTAYQKQVDSLNAKLNIALKNAPLERQAQVLANAVVAQKKQANPDMEAADLKKIKGLALTEARFRTGARKQRIALTDDEWRAIQAGAISTTKLKQILDNADPDHIKQLATPKVSSVMTATKKQRAAQMLASGYTQAEVADALGVSVTTLKTAVSEGG